MIPAHRCPDSAQLLRNALVDNPALVKLRDPVCINSSHFVWKRLTSNAQDGRTVLQNAVASSSSSTSTNTIQAILDVLEQSVDPETKKQVLENRDEGGSTALVSAVAAGNAQVVNLLLGAGADPTNSTSKGLTPLFVSS